MAAAWMCGYLVVGVRIWQRGKVFEPPSTGVIGGRATRRRGRLLARPTPQRTHMPCPPPTHAARKQNKARTRTQRHDDAVGRQLAAEEALDGPHRDGEQDRAEQQRDAVEAVAGADEADDAAAQAEDLCVGGVVMGRLVLCLVLSAPRSRAATAATACAPRADDGAQRRPPFLRSPALPSAAHTHPVRDGEGVVIHRAAAAMVLLRLLRGKLPLVRVRVSLRRGALQCV